MANTIMANTDRPKPTNNERESVIFKTYLKFSFKSETTLKCKRKTLGVRMGNSRLLELAGFADHIYDSGPLSCLRKK